MKEPGHEATLPESASSGKPKFFDQVLKQILVVFKFE
jgi:hypothetical protein